MQYSSSCYPYIIYSFMTCYRNIKMIYNMWSERYIRLCGDYRNAKFIIIFIIIIIRNPLLSIILSIISAFFFLTYFFLLFKQWLKETHQPKVDTSHRRADGCEDWIATEACLVNVILQYTISYFNEDLSLMLLSTEIAIYL